MSSSVVGYRIHYSWLQMTLVSRNKFILKETHLPLYAGLCFALF